MFLDTRFYYLLLFLNIIFEADDTRAVVADNFAAFFFRNSDFTVAKQVDKNCYIDVI